MDENKTVSKLNIVKKLVLVTIIVYVAVFAVMNTSYFTRDNLNRIVFGFKQALSGEEPEETITFEDSGDNSYGIFKGGLVVLSDKNLLIYDASGYLLSETGINFFDPVMRFSDDYILCFDRGGTTLLLLDSFGIVRQNSFRNDGYEYSILDAQFGSGGKISVITDAQNSKGTVYVYSDQFEELYEFSSVDGYPVRADILDKNILSVVSVSPRKELSDLLFYRIDYKTGEGYQSPVYSAEDRIPISFCANAGSVEVLTDTDIVLAGKDDLQVTLKTISPNTEKYDLSADYSLFSSVLSASERKYTVSCYDRNGAPVFSQEFYDLRDICTVGDVFLVLAGDKLHFLDKTGTILHTEELVLHAGSIVAEKDIIYVVGTGTAGRVAFPSKAGK